MNFVDLTGEIVETPTLKFERGDKRFFQTMILILRKSGKADAIPLVIPEREISKADGFVSVVGMMQSYKSNGRRKIMVFGHSVLPCEISLEHKNLVFMSGILKKKTEQRTARSGRDVSNGIIFTYNNFGTYETIPIVALGGASNDLCSVSIGEEVMVVGRLKSVVTADKDGFDTGCKLTAFRLEQAGRGLHSEDRIEANPYGKLQMLS